MGMLLAYFSIDKNRRTLTSGWVRSTILLTDAVSARWSSSPVAVAGFSFVGQQQEPDGILPFGSSVGYADYTMDSALCTRRLLISSHSRSGRKQNWKRHCRRRWMRCSRENC